MTPVLTLVLSLVALVALLAGADAITVATCSILSVLTYIAGVLREIRDGEWVSVTECGCDPDDGAPCPRAGAPVAAETVH